MAFRAQLAIVGSCSKQSQSLHSRHETLFTGLLSRAGLGTAMATVHKENTTKSYVCAMIMQCRA